MADNDSYTEVKTTSWGSRIGSSFIGVIFGIVLIGAAVYLLYWNEGRAVKTAKSLEEGAGMVISVDARQVEPNNNGKLIHLTGDATTTETLTDPEFAISINAIKFRRKAEMYQWQESKSESTEKLFGGRTETKTTYNYNKQWSSSLNDSNRFKVSQGHANPAAMKFRNAERVAKKVTLGGYTLSGRLLDKINNAEKIYVDGQTIQQLPAELKTTAKVHDGMYYFGNEPRAPEIGDTRVAFEAVKPTKVSLIAKQVGNGLEPYYTKVGQSIELLEIGDHSASNMFKEAQDENKMWTWILRGVGLLLMMIAFSMLFNPLVALADFIPFLGDLVGMGTGFLATSLGLTFSLITIAIGWIRFRPLVGGLILAAALVVIYYAKGAANKKSA